MSSFVTAGEWRERNSNHCFQADGVPCLQLNRCLAADPMQLHNRLSTPLHSAVRVRTSANASRVPRKSAVPTVPLLDRKAVCMRQEDGRKRALFDGSEESVVRYDLWTVSQTSWCCDLLVQSDAELTISHPSCLTRLVSSNAVVTDAPSPAISRANASHARKSASNLDEAVNIRVQNVVTLRRPARLCNRVPN